MSKRTFVILVIALIAIVLGVGWYLFFGQRSAPAQVGIETTPGANIFPFGRSGSANTGPGGVGGGASTNTASSTQGATSTSAAPVPRLMQVSHTPTAGAVAFDVGSSTLIRYVERATGHIYQVDSASPNAVELSAVTVPKVHEALWSSDGKSVILRFLRSDGVTIRTFAGKLASTTDVGDALAGAFMPDGIPEATSYGTKLFYLSYASSGEQGIVSGVDGSKPVDVFDSSFSDWTARWSSLKSVTLYPRPSQNVTGAAYLLNVSTGSYPLLLSGIPGLSAVANQDGSLVLYSGSSGNSFVSGVYDVKTGTSKDLGFETLADKCIWSAKHTMVVYCAVPNSVPGGAYPDDWYKGKVSFNDSIWKADLSTGETTDISDPNIEAGSPMDIIDMSLDQNENVLIFTNKDDMTVWRLDLTR